MTLTADECIEGFDVTCSQSWSWRKALITRLGELCDDSRVAVAIAQLCNALEDDHLRASELRSRADSSLRHLLRLLPLDERLHRALTYLAHPRRSRRRVGLAVLRETENPALSEEIMAYAREHRDADALRCGLLLGAKIEDPAWALELSDDDYLSTRVLQAALDQPALESFADDYPKEFIWAVGRGRATRYGKKVTLMLEQLLSKPPEDHFSYSKWKDHVGIAFWTLARLGLRDHVLRLAKAEAEVREALAASLFRGSDALL